MEFVECHSPASIGEMHSPTARRLGKTKHIEAEGIIREVEMLRIISTKFKRI